MVRGDRFGGAHLGARCDRDLTQAEPVLDGIDLRPNGRCQPYGRRECSHERVSFSHATSIRARLCTRDGAIHPGGGACGVNTQSEVDDKLGRLHSRRDEISDELQKRPDDTRELLNELWVIAGKLAGALTSGDEP